MTEVLRLCSVCQSVLSSIGKDTSCDYHSKCRDLYDSALGGCPLCTLVWDCSTQCNAFRNLGIEPYLDSATMRVTLIYSEPIILHFEISTRGNESDIGDNYVGNVLVFPVNSEEDTSKDGTASNTGSEMTWRVVTRWLEECERNHPNCIRKSKDDWMPTRLLDVGTSTNPDLRLYLTSEDSSPAPYTTLSHCWGKISIKKLQEANIPKLTNAINAAELPKTFRDAITITRRLGIRYIWIDSMCIVQDSPEDWHTESSRMGEVYKNCACNIAATGAPDGRTGCFVERNPLLAQRCRISIKSIPGAGLPDGLYDLVQEEIWSNGVSDAPLSRRAWVVQERTLAPRVLHFGRNQLYWECPGLTACEIYPYGLPHQISDHDSKLAPPQGIKDDPDARVTALLFWNKILAMYTRCRLTKEADKLVAISGIAKQVQQTLQDSYIAGLWKRQLPYCLLWQVVPTSFDMELPERLPLDCAPTWSWASLTSFAIVTPDIYTQPKLTMIEIIKVDVQCVTQDATGQVTSGYLKVRGWMNKFLASGRSSTDHTFDFPNITDGMTVAIFDHEVTHYSTWWCLPILEEKSLEVVRGLILSETGRQDEFQRAGVFLALNEHREVFRRPTYPLRQDSGIVQDYKESSHPTSASPPNETLNTEAITQGIATVNIAKSSDRSLSSGKKRHRLRNFFTHKSSEREPTLGGEGSRNVEMKNEERSLAILAEELMKTNTNDGWVERVITII